MAALAALAAACDALHFDFGVDGGAPGHGADCAELEPAAFACADAGPARCIGGGEAATAEIAESLGCTPAGQTLGIVRLEPPAGPGFDLYAWAAPVPWIDSPFNEEVALALFPDQCGAGSFGGGAIECDYDPWLLRIGVDADEAFLHVQAPASGPTAGAAGIGFQIVAPGGWDEPLPPASQPIDCDAVPYGPLDDALVYPDPLTGVPRQLRFEGKAPAAIAGVEGAPWICGEAADGWRQAGYLIRNAGDAPRRILGVHLRDSSAVDGPSVDFHFGLFGCLASGSIAPEQAALAASCYDHGDHPSKQIDAEVPVWDDDDPTSERLLILQVPPGAGTELYVQMDVE